MPLCLDAPVLLAFLLAVAPYLGKTTYAHASGVRFRCKNFSTKGTANVLSEPVPLFAQMTIFLPPTSLPEPLRAGSDYDQFLHSLLNNKGIERPPATIEYEFHITPNKNKTWSFFIVGGSARGGASFAVQTQSGANNGTLGSCLVSDNFNGRYTVDCIPTPTRNALLTVDLTHVDFGAFAPYGKMSFVQQQIKVPLFECAYASPSMHDQDCSHESSLDVTGGWWTEARSAAPRYNPTSWCEEVPVMNLSDCMRFYTDVYMFGESHMRFFYDYLTQQLNISNGTLEVKHSDDSAGNIHFFATHYITKGPEGGVLIDALSRTNFTNNSLILINFGSWHLHGMAVTKTILDVQNVLVPALRRILAGPNVTRILVFTAPAKFRQEGPWAGIENTASMAALLEAVQLLMPEGVAVLDIVHSTRTFMESIKPPIDWDCWNDHQCSCHIMCRLDGTTTVTGRFGKEIFREVMRRACPDAQMSQVMR
jgi:hypothetical protein